ncbi:AMP-binding protein [Lachnospiraceae bacterium ZAX-1]
MQNKEEIFNEWDRYTYAEKLSEWSEKYSENVALIEGDTIFTYKELREKVLILSEYFHEKGLKCGDIVLLQFPNSYIFVLTLLALFEVGVKAILTLPAHREKDLIRLVMKTKAKAYMAEESYLDYDYVKLAAVVKENNDSIEYTIFSAEIEKVISKNNLKNIDYEKPLAKDIALFLLSGGTTGVPKLIPRTHGDYIYNGKMCASRCELMEEDKYLVLLPAAHNFPLNNPGILGTFETGGTVVMCKYPSPMEILEIIEKYKITHTSLVPTLAIMCLQYMEWDTSFDTSSLKFVGIGGAALTSAIAKQIKEGFKCQLMQIFGTAEGLISTTSLRDSDEIVYETQGKPISEYDEIRIVNGEGENVLCGAQGELITRGPYTITGYYKAEDVNKISFTADGFYRTGDMAVLSIDNNIKIIGRYKEQINRAGEKIMPSEVEEYINDYPEVLDSVILGVPDELLGSSVCACVISRNADGFSVHDLRSFMLKLGVADYKLPDRVVFFESFPLTAVNKVDKQKLLDEVLARIS